MTGLLDIEAASYADAVHTLQQSLAGSRAQWDDAARAAFDLQHANPLLTEAWRTAAALSQLAQELNAAVRLLRNSA